MNQVLKRTAAFAALLFAFAAAPALAGTTGAVVGTVADTSGGVLPGVTIEATSTSLQGTRVAVSGSDGAFRLAQLPPGVYKVKAVMQGFKSIEKTGVTVGIDDSVKLEFKLEQSMSLETTVVEESPLIDTKSAKGGANFSEELFESLPTARSYTSIVSLTPGAGTDGTGSSTFYGSTGPENNYIIDGVNTTNIAFGTQGKNLNFDFIKEVEVKSSGYEAEFGRATGGIINVITKNGGNEYHGDGFGYWSGRSLRAATCEACTTSAGRAAGFDEFDFGGDIGGYLIKDKIWVFGALNPTFRNDFGQTPEHANLISLDSYLPRAPLTSIKTNASTRYYFATKGTFNINANNNLVLSVFGDPENNDGQARLGDAKTDSLRKSGGTDMTAKINSVLNTSLYFDAQGSIHQEKSHSLPADGDFDSVGVAHLRSGIQKHGYGLWRKNDLKRSGIRSNWTGFAGNHEFKFGVDYEHNVYDAKSGLTGGEFLSIRSDTRVRAFRYFQGFDADGNPLYVDTLQAKTITNNLALFLQDKWDIAPNFTISAGLRYEKQVVHDYEGISRINLDNNFAPRLGLIWDPNNTGKWKIQASAGRFYEVIPMDLNNRSLGAEGDAFDFYTRVTRDPVINFSPADRGTYLGSVNLGGEITPVDPDLKGQRLDELTLGMEYELMPKLVVGARGIYRKIGDVVEDLSVDDGEHYFIGNPGQGISKEGIDSNGNPVSFPLPKRTFKGFEVTMNKRLANRWQMFASYLYGKLEGNYEGLFTTDNGQLDPNITSAFDIPTLLPNRFGPLPGDRRHTFKLDGSYETPFKLSAGLSLRFQTGTPLNTLGAHPVYGNNEAFLLPRGETFQQDIIDRLWLDFDAEAESGTPAPQARNRTPSLWSVDLNLQYPLRLGSATLHMYVDIFNVFNFQRATRYTQTFTLDSVDVASLQGLPQEQIAYDPATGEPRFTTLGTNYLRPSEYQAPLRARFGAKLSF